MQTDKQGNALPGANAQAADKYDQALEAFNVYRNDPVALIDEAMDLSPEFTMANIFKAYLLGLATEPEASRGADDIISQLEEWQLSEREASHVSALKHLLNGQWTAAAVALDWHNMAYPHDLLAIQAGHLMDFYRANSQNLRDRLARVLPKWTPDIPGYSILLGMQAFGLEETGHYQRAEEVGRQAVDLQPLDCWAHHAVAHVMEMQGRAEDGIGWMIARHPHWSGDDNFFRVHNVWHQCLFHMDVGQADRALGLYDRSIRGTQSMVALDLIDASALLWRLHLSGVDVGDRWQELAVCWDIHMTDSTYPFNDWHAAMAYAGAGRHQNLDRVIAALQNLARGQNEVAVWAKDLGLPLVLGFVDFWRGEYRQAAERLYPTLFIANRFGGSHAQRDIVNLTLTETAIRGNIRHLAEALVNCRVDSRPRGAINQSLLARCRGDRISIQAA
ncbi:tetratricopeptide repeat protein [Marinobacter sp. GN3S48]|uniref:tetratricopeptide repeat protein n=1 Tax=Marinobacter sp. GN3S48 TaxID=3382302 RepID=UPI00387B0586